MNSIVSRQNLIDKLADSMDIVNAAQMVDDYTTGIRYPALEPGDLVQLRRGGPWYEVSSWAGGDIYYTTNHIKHSLGATRRVNRNGFIWKTRSA